MSFMALAIPHLHVGTELTGTVAITGSAPVLAQPAVSAQVSTYVTWGGPYATTNPGPLQAPVRKYFVNDIEVPATTVLVAGDKLQVTEFLDDGLSTRTFFSNTVMYIFAADVDGIFVVPPENTIVGI